MAEYEDITVGETVPGPETDASRPRPVSLPADTVLTGRGFVAGDAGSDALATTAHLAATLMERGEDLLVVDSDGRYEGLKRSNELLHVGGDETCDLQVTARHADRLAAVALEEDTSILLDVSSFRDESAAEAVLAAVARSLYATADSYDKSYLLLVDDIESYLPERGPVGECGRLLRTICRDGHLRGLGICGRSRDPAAVEREFISACDWQCWHRLDPERYGSVLQRRLGETYAPTVGDFADDEALVRSETGGPLHRIRVGARGTDAALVGSKPAGSAHSERTPVRPSVVAAVAGGSEAGADSGERIGELRAELRRTTERLDALEAEQEAMRERRHLAQRVVDQLFEQLGGTEAAGVDADDLAGLRETIEAVRQRQGPGESTSETRGKQTTSGSEMGQAGADVPISAPGDSDDGPQEDSDTTAELGGESGAAEAAGKRDADDTAVDGIFAMAGETQFGTDADGESGATDSGGDSSPKAGGPSEERDSDATAEESTAAFSADRILSRLNAVPEQPPDENGEQVEDEGLVEETGRSAASEVEESFELTLRADIEASEGDAVGATAGATSDEQAGDVVVPETEPEAVAAVRDAVDSLDRKPRSMLSFYREHGPSTPQRAHFAAGGDDDRQRAYAYNRQLRTREFIEHVGRGRYDYCLRAHLGSVLGDHVDERVIDAFASRIESAVFENGDGESVAEDTDSEPAF